MELFDQIRQLNATFYIIGGDFNVVRDVNLDRNVKKLYHPESHKKISNFIEEVNSIDVWRVKNQEKKICTWCNRQSGMRWFRNDYFLILAELQNWCNNCDITPEILTDHSQIQMTLQIEELHRGPGVWKLNDLLLEDPEYCEIMVDTLEKTKKQYVYMEEFDFWEMLKFQATNTSKIYIQEKSYYTKERIFKLYKTLAAMQDEWILNPNDDVINEHMPKIKAEIEEDIQEKAKRSAFRCKATYYEKGEYTTK